MEQTDTVRIKAPKSGLEGYDGKYVRVMMDGGAVFTGTARINGDWLTVEKKGSARKALCNLRLVGSITLLDDNN